MNMDVTPPRPIDWFIELEPTARNRTFPTLSDALQWVEEEREFFSFIRGASQQFGTGYPFNYASQVVSDLDYIHQQLASARDQEPGNPDAARNVAQAAKNHAQQRVASAQALLFSDNPKMQFVKDVWTNVGPSEGAHLLAACFGQLGNPSDKRCLEAAFRLFAFEQSLTGDAVNAERSAFEKLRADLTETLDEAQKIAANHRQTAVELERNERALVSSREQAFTEHQDSRHTQFTTLLAEQKSRLEDREKWFKEKLSLEPAAEYWSKKARSHAVKGWAAGVITLVFAASYSLLLVPKLFTNALGNAEFTEILKDHVGWKLGLLAALGLLGVWIARILVRMTLSHVHLASDCGHRKTLVMTYLALMRAEGEQAITTEDRRIVLEQLFRPASDGIVRDDAMPPTPAELLTRTLSGGR